MTLTIPELIGDIERQVAATQAEMARLRAARAALTAKGATPRPGAPEQPAARERPRERAVRPKEAPTRKAVLRALEASYPEPLTAGAVAQRTGLGRGSVSTTLGTLAKLGEAQKAERGYTVPGAPR